MISLLSPPCRIRAFCFLVAASALAPCPGIGAVLRMGRSIAMAVEQGAGSMPTDRDQAAARHRISIHSPDRGSLAGRMLALAEAALPPSLAVEQAMRHEPFGVRDGHAGVGVWWYGELSGVRLPFALTSAALGYYTDLIEGYRIAASADGELRQDASQARRTPQESCLSYQATVERATRFTLGSVCHRDVYVVRLHLTFAARFSPLESLAFAKSRVVVLSSDGAVLAIAGDGATAVATS